MQKYLQIDHYYYYCYVTTERFKHATPGDYLTRIAYPHHSQLVFHESTHSKAIWNDFLKRFAPRNIAGIRTNCTIPFDFENYRISMWFGILIDRIFIRLLYVSLDSCNHSIRTIPLRICCALDIERIHPHDISVSFLHSSFFSTTAITTVALLYFYFWHWTYTDAVVCRLVSCLQGSMSPRISVACNEAHG